MDKIHKEEWVLSYIQENQIADMTNEIFVDEYIEKFNPKHVVMPWGANRCRELSKLLASLYNQGILKRTPTGITHGPPGAPKWVYVYELTALGLRMAENN